MEGRSTGGELVACVNEVPEPAALRGLHRLDDDVVVPPVRADLGNAVEVRILQGAVSSLFSCAGTSGSEIRRTGSTLPRSSVTERTCMDLTDCQAAVTAGAAAESTATR